MDYAYEVTFVYTYTTVRRTIWTPETDEDKVLDIAIREIENETGLDVSGADAMVELTGALI